MQADSMFKPPVLVLVALGFATVAAGTAHAAGTIGFADPVVEIAEGAVKSVLIVRTGDATDAATAVLSTNPGSASLGMDFDIDLPTSTVEFAAGATFARVQITALADNEVERVEYADLTLSSPSGAAIGGQSSLLLLIHDSSPGTDPYVSFASTGTWRVGDTIYASPVAIASEGTAATLTVVRSPATEAGTVDLSVIGGTATAGVDFSDPTATLVFPAGTASIDFDLATLDDLSREGAETVELLLSNPTPQGTALRSALATVLINDNEPNQAGQFSLRAASGESGTVRVAENAGNAQFRVDRTAGTAGQVTVDYAAIVTSTEGGAVAGQDFVASTSTLVLPAGTAAATFSIPIIDDNVVDLFAGYEFRVVLASPTGGATIDPAASAITVHIEDNEELKLCDDGTNDCLEGPIGVGGCFIATAAYGSYLDPHVVALRVFRDRFLQTNSPGRAFVRWYYETSPPFAAWLAQHGLARLVTRLALTPLVYAVAEPYWFVALVALLLLAYVVRRTRISRVRAS
jgi:Calx-beta domain